MGWMGMDEVVWKQWSKRSPAGGGGREPLSDHAAARLVKITIINVRYELLHTAKYSPKIWKRN